MADKRPSIPKNVKIKVWTEAAGRCQFKNCNEPLWYNELTLSNTNFGQMAHIIGASKKGPRGGDLSEKLARDPENLLLVCSTCHKEIDDSITRGDYSIQRLREMKSEHTTRVRMLLEQPGKKTRPLIFTTQVGGQQTAFSKRSILQAVLPDYTDTIEDHWYRITSKSFDREKQHSWDAVMQEIDENVSDINRACSNGKVSHISVFGLAPQPLLMYLGRSLGDKISCQIFEPRRTENQDNMWKWNEEDGANIEFKTARIAKNDSSEAILLIALSDYLGDDKYEEMPVKNPSIYKITINNPVQGFVSKKSDVSNFIMSMRSLLNKIQKEVGKDCKLHIVPAMPASLAIEFGRLLQPTKDHEITVYEYISGNPKPVLKLN
ncbi:MAG: SAVED domain-containing protein [Bacteroidota bacterium]